VLAKTIDIEATIPSPPPSFPMTITGDGTWTFYASGTTEYKIEISGVPAVGGTWTVNPPGGTVSSGWHTINYTLQGAHIDLSSMPPGDQKIGEIRFYTR
jgi:hypothetical protein